MKILVTGADGFVGSWLVPRLVEAGHEVVAAIRPCEVSDELRARRDHLTDAGRIVELELSDSESIASVVAETDSDLVRSVDMPYLAGDNRKLREVTGWLPAYSLEQTLAEVGDAQAH